MTAQVVVAAAVATVDHSDIRGSKPHNRNPSVAGSDSGSDTGLLATKEYNDAPKHIWGINSSMTRENIRGRLGYTFFLLTLFLCGYFTVSANMVLWLNEP